MNTLKACCVFLMITALMASCSQTHTPAIPSDPHSFSNPEEAFVEHLSLSLVVNMEEKILQGEAVWMIGKNRNAKELILDTKELEILEVQTSNDGQTKTAAKFTLGPKDPILGEALHIPITAGTRFVHIRYNTTPGAEALQFLPPAQTHTGRSPFLLTQSQAINARTWVPCQDSPGLRFTYNATVTVPKGLLALMSAENPTQVSPDGVYQFQMTQPIPAYLLALAVGELTFRSLGPNTGVYAEPTLIDKAAYEFEEVNDMISIAEKLYGPYQWGRYDIVVLPPSFPFGGMENPRLTFATPTILAGDRSLVALVAHELAHSWSGNLVTNATWNDFWLNEGFTVYFENRIMEALKGAEYANMLAQISLKDLNDEVRDMGSDSPDTKLAIDLAGTNPDDGVTSIAYDKGFFFLKTIEKTVGREAFDAFLIDYFNKNAFKTMTTDEFVAILREDLLVKFPGSEEQIGVDNWVYGTGIPDNLPIPQSDKFTNVEKAVSAWIAGVDEGDLGSDEWTSHEWLHFIHSLPDGIDAKELGRLDSVFHLTASTNSEVQAAWYERAIKSNYLKAKPAIRKFLTTVGRRKFLMPLYGAMKNTPGWEQTALDIYREARPRYHPISVISVDQLLSWQE
ncbi:MAG: M1 family metallopeptidase [Bacteroidia bacterium]|nr:M1 family metallopeptidase [Bacteroidia bacterium]